MKNEKTNNSIVIYDIGSGQPKIEVRIEGETVWLTQRKMAELFECSVDNISLHLKNIFKEGELEEKSVFEESSTTATDGKKYKTKFYNLDAIIAVGYRVNSKKATRFSIWATRILREFIIKGFAMDDERLKNLGGGNYWKELLDRIRDIRSGGDRETCRCRTTVHGAAHFFRRRSYQERYRYCQELSYGK